MEPSRADFCHPYQPYDIQLQFMKDLYKTIEDGKVGIFESPTGTGKSLSLICGSLTWLRDHKRRVLEGSTQKLEPGEDPDWMVEAETQQRRHVVLQQREELESRLYKVRQKERETKRRLDNHSRPPKKPRNRQDESPDQAKKKGDEEFLPDEYNSDDLAKEDRNSTMSKDQDVLSSSTQALLAKLNGVKGAADQEGPALNETRVIFCSRTHSQLTQFVKELRRVQPPPSMISLNEKGIEEPSTVPGEEIVKHLSLGSRKNLCINHKVSRLGSVTAINDKCLDLQKTGVSEEQKCPFLPKKDNQDLVERFRDHALAEIHDIEDLADIGRSVGVCPYYASRAGIESTEMLTLPYPLLLQKSARVALGVSVKDHVVIIDEAHNLIDAIAETYSCSISLDQIKTATSQVMIYVQKFKNRLKGENRMFVTQIIRLLNSISECIRSITSSTNGNEAIITPAQLLAGKGVDQIQPYQLISYLQESKLAHKVENYAQSMDEKADTGTTKPHNRSALQLFQSFLAVLMNPSAEGRFFFSRDEQKRSHIRYTLLDPREHFRDIVEEARAVILAGGTMSPMSDYRDYLFSYLPPERLKSFSFGHVVPPENLFARSISKGPRGVEFDFTFEGRKSEEMIVELGLLFIRACRVIPDGIVAFLPSYDFLNYVISVWKKTALPSTNTPGGQPKSSSSSVTIFTALNAIKPIFYETKPNSPRQNQPPSSSSPSNVSSSKQNLPPPHQESLLQSYTQTIDNPPKQNPSRGALLLSITSGTLSEGINFSDRLCRCVLCIGLPYPNPHSAVWKAKMQHIESLHLQKGKTWATTSKIQTPNPSSSGKVSSPTPSAAQAAAQAKQASRDFYTNATIRAVNQSIGRAIRHRHDYAAVLLVDRRFSSLAIKSKLPGWISEAVERDTTAGGGGKGGWDGVENGLVGFFESKI